MRQKWNKKKQGTNLINHNQLARLRNQKEKIITNPFEENWKKAIVMEELLNLYQPQEAGLTPTTKNYNKKNYQNWASSIRPQKQQPWEDNDDNQVNKFYKMADGINRWQQNFHDNHIDKILSKVSTRKKTVFKSMDFDQQAKCQENKPSSKKLKIKNKDKKSIFEQFNGFVVPKKPRFAKQKKQIQKLKEKATNKYGVFFNKEQVVEVKMDLDSFRKRDEQIFQKFTKSMKHSRVASLESLTGSETDFGSTPLHFDKIDLKTFNRIPQREIKLCQTQKAFPKKRYLRLH